MLYVRYFKEWFIVEIWKDIKGYEGMYQVSNYGRVKGLERWTHFKNGRKPRREPERILKFTKHHKGYFKAQLRKEDKLKGYFVHRLVAEAFIPNPEGKSQVNHKDGNKGNNHVDNLEWNTQSENLKHSYHVLGSHRKSVEAMYEPRMKAKRKPVIVYDLEGNFVAEFKSQAETAKAMGVCSTSVSAATRGLKGYVPLKGHIYKNKDKE